MKQFYTHLIEIKSLVVELDKMDLSVNEKLHLSKLIDSNLHHTILDVILTELSEEDKLKFLNLLKTNDHNKIWEHLNDKVDKVEEKINKAIEEIKVELHEDIKKSQKLKKL